MSFETSMKKLEELSEKIRDEETSRTKRLNATKTA